MAPEVLEAINPVVRRGVLRPATAATAFLILGSVVLAVTGARGAVRRHGALRPAADPAGLVRRRAALRCCSTTSARGAAPAVEPGRRCQSVLLPGAALGALPVVGIATAAAIVASQALISGAFSLTRQAVQLGYIPRVTIVHTSSTEIGQIYIPEVNWALWRRLPRARGRVPELDQPGGRVRHRGHRHDVITTLLFLRWPATAGAGRDWRARRSRRCFCSVDLAFFSANIIKIEDGGWFPIVVGLGVYLLMTTWNRGRAPAPGDRPGEHPAAWTCSLPTSARRQPPRVPGTAVFLTSDIGGAPPVLLHHLKHNKVLHEKVILMSVVTEEIPSVDEEERVRVQGAGAGILQGDCPLRFHGVARRPGGARRS